MLIQQVEIITGNTARELLCDAQFITHWRSLYNCCPYATGFQSPNFVITWYEAYRSIYQPVLLLSHTNSGELVGLWLLAYDPSHHVLVHAGAHQAEYHVWLAKPHYDAAFIEHAWKKLESTLSFRTLLFRYLPSCALADLLCSVPGIGQRMSVRRHSRPLLKLDAAEIRASFAKKSNKSRFNRVKKLGLLEFRRITEPEQFEQVFDDLVIYYDFRQGAVHSSTPFLNDPHKRQFCRDLFNSASHETHFTVSSLDGRTIAALWGTVTGTKVHVGMIAYSPFLAEHSPGKLHLMQLGNYLLQEGIEILDLTPGDDLWKERFANCHDNVADVLLYRSVNVKSRADVIKFLSEAAKYCAAKVGVVPNDVRRFIANLRSVRPSRALCNAAGWIKMQQEYRVFRVTCNNEASFRPDTRVSKNTLSDLLCYQPDASLQSRDAFLSKALSRLEQGESVYTVCVESRLVLYVWTARQQTELNVPEVQQAIMLPEECVTLSNFFIHPDFREQGLYLAIISHVLNEVFADEIIKYAYITVTSKNPDLQQTIESLGFECLGVVYRKRLFGTESTWSCGSLFVNN